MLHIVLIRPGSTDYDEQGRIQGSLDIPLSEQGLQEAAATAEALQDLSLEVLYTPVAQPPLQTADIIAQKLGLKRKKLDRLQNHDQGLWQGMLIDDVRHKQPKVYRQWQEQPENVCPPEGEMLAEADERLRAAVSKLLKRHKEGGVIGIVLPEPLFSLARRFLAHQELGDLWKISSGPNRFETLSVDAEELLSASV